MSSGLSAFSTYRGVRATVLGLGTFGGGVAAAQFLADRGALVTVTDLRSEDELAESLKRLARTPLRRVLLNGHPEDAFSDCDLLVVNPAVPPTAVVWSQALQNEPVTSTETALFLHHSSARIVAVSGSNGKSTTAALIHHLLSKSGCCRRSWLGGNIGHSLLPDVDQMTSKDIAVLEVSSFQLHYLQDFEFAPDVAVITNFTPNHLDWHRTLEHYQKAKQVLLNRQAPRALAVLPEYHDVNVTEPLDGVPAWRVRAECLRFGCQDAGEDGVFAAEGLLLFRRGVIEDAVRWQPPKSLPGRHNQRNVAAALAATWHFHEEPQRLTNHLQSFEALPHRLQTVARTGGLRFIDDSVATTPESAIAALQAMTGPTVLIAGGADKGLDLQAFATAIVKHAAAVILIGQTAERLESFISRQAPDFPRRRFDSPDDFAVAVRAAVELSPQGGIVLLSPGCASYGWFRDYRHRGAKFVAAAADIVQNLNVDP
ncbi:MAG: UDP-N-acetylmuramoyl-L-alanine--D-glutamate ligase [Fuerstiella sp.]